MARPNKPWYRQDRDVWVVKIAGKQVVLARGKANRGPALKAFYALMLAPENDGTVTVSKLAEFVFSWNRIHLAHETQMLYRRFLGDFAEKHGDRDACLITPIDVRDWLATKTTWNDNTKHTVVQCLRRAFSLAKKEKLIAVNNMVDMANPRAVMPEVIINPEDIGKMISSIRRKEFLDLITFMYETGCRPGEAAKLESRHVSIDGAVATMSFKTTRLTGKQRRIYLSDKAREIVERLSALRPSGPIFRNKIGNPWTKTAVHMHMRAIRARAGLPREIVAKALRHNWITDALVRGVPIATVAELAGHSSTRMIEQVYSKLSQRHDYLKQSVQTVRPVAVDNPKS